MPCPLMSSDLPNQQPDVVPEAPLRTASLYLHSRP